MPANKDFKRVVRARMTKTGEAYTTARANLLHLRKTPAKPDYATLAGKSDALIKARTGCTWERWVAALDFVKAHEWAHREIAEYAHEKFKVPGWWAQMVAVGYERIKGLRVRGQRRDGSYEASKSKVFGVPLARLYRAVHDARARTRWLPGVAPTVRHATRGKTIYFTWPDRTSVAVWFVKVAAAKTQLAIQHSKLPDQATAAQMKTFWGERLGALAKLVAP